MDVTAMSDAELRTTITLIEENLAECGPRSSYAHRNRPILRAAKAEARKREQAPLTREQERQVLDWLYRDHKGPRPFTVGAVLEHKESSR